MTFAKRRQCKREEKGLPNNTQRNDEGKEQLQGERERERGGGEGREERGQQGWSTKEPEENTLIRGGVVTAHGKGSYSRESVVYWYSI